MKFKIVSISLAISLLVGAPSPGQTTPIENPLVIDVSPTATDYTYTNAYAFNVSYSSYALYLISQSPNQGGDSAGISSVTNNTSGSITLTNVNGGATALNVESLGANNNNGNGGTAGPVQVFNYGPISVKGTVVDSVTVLSVGSVGGNGTGGTGQGGGTSGVATVHEYGALFAGTAATPLQGNGYFRGLDLFSNGGSAGLGENGYDGSAGNSVNLIGHPGADVSAFWQDANTSGTNNTYGVRAISTGGNGGSVGMYADTGKSAGVAGAAGQANVSLTDENITLVTNLGNVTYTGTVTDILGAGVAALSIGGNGGVAGQGSGNNPSYAGDGGVSTAGTQSTVTIVDTNINVTGDFIGGLLARNTGGNGGSNGMNGTDGADHSYAGNGGTAGNMVVSVSGTGGATYSITTQGVFAVGLEAGNRGGAGGYTNTLTPTTGGVEGDGGAGAGAGTTAVTLNGKLNISTAGINSIGVLAYSVGGNGGNSGDLSAVGDSGTAGNGGAGGLASSVNVGISGNVSVSTTANKSSGVIAVSEAGFGGKGGDFGGIGFSGNGGNGGNGGNSGAVTVIVANGSSITTTGDNSSGIVALSLSGAGGAGGARDGGGSAGSGGTGGNTGVITVNNAGFISTTGTNSYGILAQGSSGAGGSAGYTDAVFYSNNPSGSSSGMVGAISLTNSGTITTKGDGSYGIFGLSVAGGGGAGGSSFSAVGASLGGDGGVAASAGPVTLNFNGSTTTSGNLTPAILLQSIGGGGGDGGTSTGIVSIGGAGSAAGSGGDVIANLNSGSITTYGEQSLGVLAQSIGGGGGNAGNARSVAIGAALAIGEDGGAGGNGGSVTINSGANITTTAIGASTSSGTTTTNMSDIKIPAKSIGILAQSVGGGGGNGGAAYAESAGLVVSAAASYGGNGGAGGDGGNVTVNTTGGTIWTGQFATPTAPTNTLPVDAIGILAQSIGGGGGNGGSALAAALAVGVPTETGNEVAVAAATSMGGNGAVGGNAGTVNVNLGGSTQVTTQGQGSHGVLAQAIGGGGGNGGDSSAMAATIEYSRVASKSAPEKMVSNTVSITVASTLGGTGSIGSNGGNVVIELGDAGKVTNSVTTYGDYSNALLAQSIGGGGGNSGLGSGTTQGYGASAGVSVTDVVGSQGGAGGTGGTAFVKLDGNGAIVTYGSESIGIASQSIGRRRRLPKEEKCRLAQNLRHIINRSTKL